MVNLNIAVDDMWSWILVIICAYEWRGEAGRRLKMTDVVLSIAVRHKTWTVLLTACWV